MRELSQMRELSHMRELKDLTTLLLMVKVIAGLLDLKLQ
jgi:hypothetical protein